MAHTSSEPVTDWPAHVTILLRNGLRVADPAADHISGNMGCIYI